MSAIAETITKVAASFGGHILQPVDAAGHAKLSDANVTNGHAGENHPAGNPATSTIDPEVSPRRFRQSGSGRLQRRVQAAFELRVQLQDLRVGER